jgi:hypothetical protein
LVAIYFLLERMECGFTWRRLQPDVPTQKKVNVEAEFGEFARMHRLGGFSLELFALSGNLHRYGEAVNKFRLIFTGALTA